MHYNPDVPTRAEATPPEWLPVGGQIADFVNNRSGRNDIIGYVGKDAGHGAAACFAPQIAEIELDVQRCFGEGVAPGLIGDVNDRETLFEYPAAAGALIHEASHAKNSSLNDLILANEWLKQHKDPRVPDVIAAFEESRIESIAVTEWPSDVGFLRSCAMDLVLSTIDVEQLEQANPYAMASALLLTVAREDAGVLIADDVDRFRDLAIEFFGQEIYDQLRDIWLRAQQARPQKNEDTVWDELVPLAEQWIDLLPEDPNQEQMDMMAAAGIATIIIEMDESSAIGGGDDADDQQTQERNDAIAKAIEAVAKEIQNHRKEAEKVFGKSPQDMHPYGTNSEIDAKRLPTDEERQAAIVVGRALEKARYTDRVETEISSRMPPGRLNTNAAMTELAQRELGTTITAQPWRQVQRRQVDDPTLTVGVLVDISGSMDRAMLPMAVTAWVMANAGHRIDAKVAQVYFGNAVFPTLRPGERMPEVVIRTAPDGGHQFNRAFMALDGGLNLIHGTGARLLVICSDTYYGTDENQALERWCARCVESGVGVLILPFDDGRYVRQKRLPKQVQVITHTMQPTQAALAIGQAAIKALESVGKPR